ncbi:SHUGOSHIN 2 [Manihot esculenta]|uniref:Uncharacterized protein n=2 Tax=Manihot esculenta TaxID=3983 RepID=A0ACB7HH25_MANES|nr:SHUGOSHIN 2 [Manihot esculenta]XP_043814110.1 SHUGOSHIN 2 [Manihot esculenta]KAG8651098.1 hypothetical protein MANES_07G094800v8 [Manihot esculenta]OAY45824.1 hypothetical protein MANES_07G094800v8 [Manihot esculenta]
MEDGSEVENMPRKTLADISNLSQQNQDKRLESISFNPKDYINKLHQENLSLVKLLADRNKIIQSHVFQLQKLRTECQQLQQKNLQLAQSNSQMLAELNTSKDRLKVLQHELGCKNILLKVRELESEDKANVGRCQINGAGVETMKHDEVGEFCQPDKSDNEPCNKKRRRQSKSLDSATVKPVQPKERINKKRQSATYRAKDQETTDDVLETCNALDALGEPTESEKKVNNKRLSARRQSARFKTGKQEPTDDIFETNDTLGPTTVKPVQSEMKIDNKRHGSRRQSARFKCQEQVHEASENLFQKDDAKFSISPLHECGPTSSVSSLKDETEAALSAPRSEAQALQTSSVRPKRQAVEKVQSYKEIPINIKMRRTN